MVRSLPKRDITKGIVRITAIRITFRVLELQGLGQRRSIWISNKRKPSGSISRESRPRPISRRSPLDAGMRRAARIPDASRASKLQNFGC